MDRPALVDLLARSVGGLDYGRPRRIAITGPTAAGKTTLADELAIALRAAGETVHRSELDDFHRPGHKYRSEREEWTPELYWDEGYDYAAFRRFVLDPLGPGGDRRCRLAFFSSYLDEPLPEEWVEAADGDILLADGILLLHPALPPAWDLAAWVEVSEETTLARATRRDLAWSPDAAAIERRYRGYHLPVHRRYAASGARERADLVIDNTDPLSPLLLRGL